jgi:membrane protein DedA with SNARE-associated domain
VGLLTYWLGHAVEHIVKTGGIIGAVVVVLAFGAFLNWRWLRRRRESRR